MGSLFFANLLTRLISILRARLGWLFVPFQSPCVTLAGSRARILRRGAAERTWHALLRCIES